MSRTGPPGRQCTGRDRPDLEPDAGRRAHDDHARDDRERIMGTIKVHEFTTLDGRVGAPMWTMDYGFTEQMTSRRRAHRVRHRDPARPHHVRDVRAAWSTRTAEDDPGAPFFNDTPKYVVSSTLDEGVWEPATILGGYDAEKIASSRTASTAASTSAAAPPWSAP